MKIAFIHDYLLSHTGSEKLFGTLIEIMGDGDIYTILYDREKFKYLKNVRSTFLDNLKIINYKYLVPFFPVAVKSIDLGNYDIIISSSHAWSKNINKPEDSLHICYCHTPMKFAWDFKKIYLDNESLILRPVINLYLNYLKKWDYKNTKNVDYFIANSKNVADRIKRYYNRDSIIIYPPLDTEFHIPNNNSDEGFFLIVSRLVEYKRIDIAIKAFNKLGLKLRIIGSGRDENKLKKLVNGSNIEFLGRLSDLEVREYYRKCTALIFPGEEDLGFTPLEAQSCGKPVIAYGKGGTLETVIEGETGHFFHKQTPEALIKAIKEFNNMEFNAEECRENALRFDKEIFKKKIKEFIKEKYREFKNAKK